MQALAAKGIIGGVFESLEIVSITGQLHNLLMRNFVSYCDNRLISIQVC